MQSIHIVDPTKTVEGQFSAHLSDCVILTKDNKILMQKRPENWGSYAGALNIFGGHIEKGETVLDALIRELNEELGAVVNAQDVLFIGAVTEELTDHTEIVHVHFWHDKDGTITGCYEAEAREYETARQALEHPKIMDYAAWALRTCKDRGLIN